MRDLLLGLLVICALIICGVVIFALLGFVTLFILFLAAKLFALAITPLL